MRTTVNIDDALLKELRQRSAREGRSLGAVISDALRAGLTRRQSREPSKRADALITFRGKGVRPGVNLDSMSDLLDVMGEDR